MNDNNASFRHQLTLDDRQAAERKLCRLFGSFGIHAQAMRDRLIDPYLERAAAFWRPNSGADFAALAIQEESPGFNVVLDEPRAIRHSGRDGVFLTEN